MQKLQLFEDPSRYTKLTSLPVTIGRDPGNDMVLSDAKVSDFHAQIDSDAQGLYIVDLLSASGTFVNEHRVVDRQQLRAWDVIRVGTTDLEINDPGTCRPDSWVLRIESDLLASQFYTLQQTTLVGRDPDCDLTIDGHLLSRQHAQLQIEGDHLRVKDLGSRNGTYLNGQKIEEAIAHPGDELKFDEQRFIVVGPRRGVDHVKADEDQTVLRGHAQAEYTQQHIEPEVLAVEADSELADEDETRLMPPANDDDATRLFVKPEAREQQPEPAAFLSLQSAEQQGQRFILTPGSMAIGRASDNDIVLEQTGVSKRHAVVDFQGGNWIIRDCDSRNGVQVNDKPVTEARLQAGDSIALGAAVLVFECADMAGTAIEDDETVIYQKPASKQTGAGPDAVTHSPGRSLSWLPGLMIFLLAASLATAIYYWRAGQF
jgi:pSer/pThr/pTyr-binding forkhead associated (FHA) protein